MVLRERQLGWKIEITPVGRYCQHMIDLDRLKREMQSVTEDIVANCEDWFGRRSQLSIDIVAVTELVCPSCGNGEPKTLNQCPGCGNHVCERCEETYEHECERCIANNIGGITIEMHPASK